MAPMYVARDGVSSRSRTLGQHPPQNWIRRTRRPERPRMMWRSSATSQLPDSPASGAVARISVLCGEPRRKRHAFTWPWRYQATSVKGVSNPAQQMAGGPIGLQKA